jgi:ketosteroid isomerase-like protein
MAAKYIRAWEAGDIDRIVAMLTEDAIQSMAPWEEWFAGRESLRNMYTMEDQWGGPPGPGRWRVLPTRFKDSWLSLSTPVNSLTFLTRRFV